MQKLASILILSSLLSQLLLPIPVMLDYALRYQEYAEQLCENKDNPESQCNGSCQVVKILQCDSSSQEEPGLPAFRVFNDWFWLGSDEIPQTNIDAKTFDKPLVLSKYLQPFLAQAPKPPSFTRLF
ncbi:hypothetical protein [Croceimicrobium sp.]|uniref:hypothetical protein n=1 Tax=Croceimicrobium sp. TaxID=2828340 RepID=UPI003BAD3E7A